MSEELQIGDKVKIVSSPYTNHPGRMAGGTGTVFRVTTDSIGNVFMANISLDYSDGMGDGKEKNIWAFFVGELEKLP